MTYRERRLVTLLSGVLSVLVIALLIVLAIRYRAGRPDAAAASSSAPLSGAGTVYTGLTYHTDDATLAFHLDDTGHWVWTHDEDFPLEERYVTELLDILSALTPQQTLTAPETFDTYGLTEPWASLTATMSDGSVTTLDFGSATTDGDSYYALLNGGTDQMYIYADTLIKRMEIPIYDMCTLPQMPELTTGRIQRITIQGAAAPEGQQPLRITMDAAQDGSGGTLWTCSNKDVTSNPRLGALLGDLSVLSIEKCVDYRPSAKALSLCGFDDPAATLWANYTTATDLGGHIQITVGALTLDGAARYVRFGGDGFDGETVYRVATELLDPLMVIALSGLEG